MRRGQRHRPGQAAISGRRLEQQVELGIRGRSLFEAEKSGCSPRVGILPGVAVKRGRLGRDARGVVEVARGPVELDAKERTSGGEVALDLRGSERPDRGLCSSAGTRRRPARHELDRSAERPRTELRSEDAAADDHPIEQRGGHGGQIDRASARTLQRDPVEEDQRLVRAGSAKREAGGLPRRTRLVHRRARRGCKHLRRGTHLSAEPGHVDRGSGGARRLRRSARPLAGDLDGLAHAAVRLSARGKRRFGEDGNQQCKAPGGAERRQVAPLFLSKRRKRIDAARQVSWLPGLQRPSRCAPSLLPRPFPDEWICGTGCPATVAGPRRRSTGFPRGPLPGAPRRRTSAVDAAVPLVGH